MAQRELDVKAKLASIYKLQNAIDVIRGEQSAWRKDAALGLPHGSVRALLALLITAGIWAWLYKRPDMEVPSYLRDLMFIIMGHYFASRHAPSSNEVGGPPPLWLPAGSVRTILVGGFLFIGAFLFWQHRIITAGHLNNAAVTLILVVGFMLGVFLQKITPKHMPRYVEDTRAIVSLAAGVLLLLMVFGIIAAPNNRLEAILTRIKIEDILAALVGFYFGSRS